MSDWLPLAAVTESDVELLVVLYVEVPPVAVTKFQLTGSSRYSCWDSNNAVLVLTRIRENASIVGVSPSVTGNTAGLVRVTAWLAGKLRTFTSVATGADACCGRVFQP
jgi:hypothetical protein